MKNFKGYPGIPNEAESFPRVSIILPFEPKMNRQCTLFDMLKAAADKVEKDLTAKYPEQRLRPVIEKLHHLIAGIRCRKDKMSICILVSPLTEKFHYFTPTKQLLNKFPSSLN